MKPGDHIRIMKPSGWDHGIDVGDRTVIHFVRGAGARRSSLSDLATAGARIEVVTHPERVYPPKLVVGRAFSRLGDPAYATAFADAESFATWCLTGRAPPRALGPFPPSAMGATAKGEERARPARPRSSLPGPKRKPAQARPKAGSTRKARAGKAVKKSAAKKPAPRRSAKRAAPAVKRAARGVTKPARKARRSGKARRR